ncbi:hypothetical protein SARC_03876 [Sphaeroforma arctica JP610]|uniref:Sorting nexin protein WASP-binding domain-containing protein n=1 Tax=Sphaeroforma arctica JP610 TaxID=667725 RepID=A0A0L0G4Y5_9EUKA|nr:hypothetical protein SARC_03876 [Sphaeroforma arctica JP610]KNC83886.1 hypothetical protein SARC_03876 [Sphaeroforma arctica JP610]|eukprot:XP_014157788.1 hypothetical protein SARC_03876 [Sphaeroforma arctica JP610]
MMLLAKPPTEGLMTACWRATCAADTRATRGIMVTSQAFDAIGQMSKRNYPRHVQMVSDITKEYTRMIPQYENIADAQALASHKANDAMAGLAEGKLEVSYSNAVQDRYEVISNIALAEANNFHAYKEKDFKAMMERFLDGQIDHYKEVLTKLEKAREAIEEL